MKTLESIRVEIWEEMLRLEDKRNDQWADIKYQTLREVLQKLGHLDDPEVLSQGYNQQAYRDGFKEGERQTAEYFESITEEPSREQVWKYLSEHGIEVVDKEPETVVDVVIAFWKSYERLKEAMSMEVEEMEE